MSLSAKPSGSTLVLASSTPVLPCKTKSSRLRRVSPFPWPAAAAIGADIALCSGSYSSPLTQRQCSQTASFRATATAALFFAFFPTRSQSRSPYRRNSVSGPNGPKMYCALPRTSRLRCRIGYNDCGSTRPNHANLFASMRSLLRLRRFDPSINRGFATNTSCPPPL